MSQSFDFRVAILTYFGFLVALTMHEAAHAFMAKFLGDRSAETSHRATINPLPHIDPWGTLIFPAIMILSPMSLPIVFGWAKPTNFDPNYFKKMKRDINLVSLAGPGANFLIAILCGVAIKLLGSNISIFQLRGFDVASDPAGALLGFTAISNVVIGILNFLPFPGSDGWRILLNSVSYNLAQKLNQSAFMVSMGMLLLLFLGVFNPIIGGCLYLYGMVFGLI